ncbi:hypothetical protein [Engelhardtia mirabilis]|uniref:Uncharacterized protein n=1 Tax=Engelhardtia mirabilis TaxID=2528011 RepID=A0A518BMV3_9BACT|nr:hypothetical protein Pla133_34010 [Planctomycetes bacterium Pla133]QDV02631.1 hypothetical protein Pla86_34000 [Planctomycetes bacterium Pla86]
MSPRILDLETCPHCKARLPRPTPRVCPECAGSLQKRYLSSGCLTSKPMLLLIGIGCGLVAATVHLVKAAVDGA